MKEKEKCTNAILKQQEKKSRKEGETEKLEALSKPNFQPYKLPALEPGEGEFPTYNTGITQHGRHIPKHKHGMESIFLF